MKTRFKVYLPLLAALTATFVLVTAIAAIAAVSTDKWLYEYGETVQITGDGMLAGETVSVEITYPDGSLAQHHDVVADDAGNFADTFYLAEGMPAGIYGVLARGETSGIVFTTEFDPPDFISTFTVPSTTPKFGGDYSDVIQFAGTVKCIDKSGAIGNKCTTNAVDINIELKGGQFADWTEVTSYTESVVFAATADSCATGCTQNWSINWQAGRAGTDPVAPGTYAVRATGTGISGGLPAATGIAGGVVITKEDTATVYGGPATGVTNTSVTVSATVADEDVSRFEEDSVFGGTIAFDLKDGTTVLASASDTTLVWNATTKKWDASASLSLTGVAAGSYTLETTFTPSAAAPATATYYNGSSDSDAFAVTAAGFTVTFSQPIDGNGTINIAKLGRVIPVKVGIVDGNSAPVTTGPVYSKVTRLASCGGSSGDTVETYVAGSSSTGNQFDLAGDRWIQNLDTRRFPSAAANQCYRVDVYVGGSVSGTGIADGGTLAGSFLVSLTK